MIFKRLLHFALVVGPLQTIEAAIVKIDEAVIDPQALCFTNGTWGIAINGLAFQQDALTSYNGWQYATYYDSNRHVCVARRKLHANGWETIRFSDYTFKGTDAHNVATLGICPADGTIHLSYDHHGHPLHYRVSQSGVATRPVDFKWTTNLFGPTTSELERGKKLTHVTYPRFVRRPDGGLQFDCRIGGSGNGDEYLADYVPAERTFTNFGIYSSRQGTYAGSISRNAYINGLTYDGLGRLHVTWNWREKGNPMSNHDLDYAWSEDNGETWLNNTVKKIGTRGKQPFSLNSPNIRVVEIAVKRGLSNSTTQAVDSRNRIHLVTLHLPDNTAAKNTWDETRPDIRFFHYWREDSGAWHRNETTLTGSRPQLWFDEQDNAYIAFVGDRRAPTPYLSIAMATAKNKWNDWTVVDRETGPFIGEPQVDRYTAPGLLSIYIQERPKAVNETASALKVFTFRVKP
jgi:hypothetical protein